MTDRSTALKADSPAPENPANTTAETVKENGKPALKIVSAASAARPRRNRWQNTLESVLFRFAARTGLGASQYEPAEQTGLSPLSTLWPTHPERSDAILNGRLLLAGRTVEFTDAIDWNTRKAGEEGLAELHSFLWLRELLSGSFNGEHIAQARALWKDWQEKEGSHPALAFRADITGERLSMLLEFAHLLLKDSEEEERKSYYKRMHQQALHLLATPPDERCHAGFAAVKGLVFASLYLPYGHFLLRKSMQWLKLLVQDTLYTDGGHISRSPLEQLRTVRTLLEIRAILSHNQKIPPEFLGKALGRASGMLRMLTHNDSGLALFNNTLEGERDIIQRCLLLASEGMELRDEAADSGFQRLETGELCLIMDSGAPNHEENCTFSGTLSFELTSRGERLVVNCGAYRGPQPQWGKAVKSSAAHSTLSLGSLALETPHDESAQVRYLRNDTADALSLEAEYDGYLAATGYVYQRELTLRRDALSLKGVDRLKAVREATPPQDAVLRFHLHPSIQAEKQGSAPIVRLILPSGQEWWFEAEKSPKVHVEESIYLGQHGQPEPTRQIVVELKCEATGAVQGWRFHRGRPAGD